MPRYPRKLFTWTTAIDLSAGSAAGRQEGTGIKGTGTARHRLGLWQRGTAKVAAEVMMMDEGWARHKSELLGLQNPSRIATTCSHVVAPHPKFSLAGTHCFRTTFGVLTGKSCKNPMSSYRQVLQLDRFRGPARTPPPLPTPGKGALTGRGLLQKYNSLELALGLPQETLVRALGCLPNKIAIVLPQFFYC